ncbi:G-type lectin S-receptor-like serine/threonine-protein kinase LECRK1 [Camellia lanceoleosa]|uniref:G-type lectin S-receptor-like serine/threonine-protein kinase LECRK1 n=1 Tax=Camellia lanceoleosa TaxID=1840588 RepID=A0ACC0F8D3_9ERIC|nr:G-type lectin S-receptor-like serine/threonine-protein kinase LECRK1 [Camellia lanceoleosa]
MASIVVVLLIFFILFAVIEAQKKTSNLISLGSFLSPISKPNSWLSPSGLFAFGFYPERNGFAVGIWIIGNPNNTVVWTANRDYPPVSSNSTIEFTRDGRLILNHTQQGTELAIADFTTPSRVLSASMLDSGNFVIYNNDSSVIWQSFDFPTDTILGNQTLFHGQRLVSSASSSFDHSSGRYRLQMQVDGNLVAFPINCTDSDFAYASASARSLPGANGYYNLTITISSLRLLTLAKASASGASPLVIIYRATLDDDGIFRLYSHRFASYNTSSNVLIEWPMLQDHCKVYGFCGFNSYCSITTGTQADCYCYPGFVLVNPSKKFLGCYMNFTEQHCRNKEGFGLVNITTLEKLRWFGLAYSVVPANNKEDCKKSCLEDCRCGAAMYVSGQCNKHKLPLRYGTRNLSDSDTYTAFVKFTSTTAPANIPNQIAPDSTSPSSPMVVTENKGHLISILAGSLGSLACLCIVIAISSFFWYRHLVHKYKKLSDNAKSGLSIDEFSLRSFSYNELEEVTQGFREEMGKGSFGTVYKGTLVSGGGNKNIVAVKRLENIVEEEGDMEFQFQIEVTAIGRTHHRNLVRLLGFCVEGKRKLLVYEYMNNGSLADVLFKEDTSRHPGWKERVKIALDIARGILYLHEEGEACIVHCGIKPQNILMDDSWTAKISDFGLSKLLMRNHMNSSYLAPEWQQQRCKQDLISVKVDIYSFGVVLLEIICSRKNIEVNVSNEDEMILSTWAYKCFVGGELHKLLVGDEEMRVDSKTVERMVKVGLLCVQDDLGMRPSIKDVILILEGTMNIPVPPPPYPISLQ